MKRPHSSRSLQLHMVLSHGQRTNAVLPLVAGQRMSMGDVFASSPEAVSEAQRIAVEQCRLSSSAAPGGERLWWLENRGTELTCSVNGHRLGQGDRSRLNEGDVLEVGLMRWVVESAEPGLSVAPGVPLDSLPASTPPQTEPYPDFALTDLLLIEQTQPAHAVLAMPRPAASGNNAARQLIDGDDSLFNDIVDMAYQLDMGAPDDKASTVLHASPSDADGAPEPHVAEDESILDNDAPAVMRDLHAQYLRLMRNPHESSTDHDWSLYNQPQRYASDALGDLTLSASEYDNIYDLLGETDAIDTVLARLDTLNDRSILHPDPQVDLLRLFAPADLQAHDATLPGLTRREHHFLSADSAAHLDHMPASTSCATDTVPPSVRPEDIPPTNESRH